MWETWVQSLGREEPLEKEMATHFSILAWKIPWTEELVGLQSMGSQKESDTTEGLTHRHTYENYQVFIIYLEFARLWVEDLTYMISLGQCKL